MTTRVPTSEEEPRHASAGAMQSCYLKSSLVVHVSEDYPYGTRHLLISHTSGRTVPCAGIELFPFSAALASIMAQQHMLPCFSVCHQPRQQLAIYMRRPAGRACRETGTDRPI